MEERYGPLTRIQQERSRSRAAKDPLGRDERRSVERRLARGTLAPVRLARALVVVSPLLLACDSRDHEQCSFVEDPAVTSGARQGKCQPSVVNIDYKNWREVSGIVRRGESGVAGALVRVEPSEGFLGEAKARVSSTLTDAAGFFGPMPGAALRYDISFRADQDVLIYRGATTRFIQPAFDASGASSSTSSRSWVGRLDVQLDAPLADSETITFFASGNAIDVVGDLDRGISLIGSEYTFPATLHAVVHDKNGDLSTAKAYGKVDVVAKADSPALARLAFKSIEESKETKVTVAAPPGYTAQAAEILVGYSRTSYRVLTTIPIGVTKRLPVIPNHGYYAYRVRAFLPDGAVSDSGEKFFDLFSSENKIELPRAPVAEKPTEGAVLASSDRLEARGQGIFEHILVPKKGGGTIQLVTSGAEAALPDLTTLGASPPKGEYSWRVRCYPDVRFVDGLGGADARRFPAVGTSAPRSVVFP